MTARAKQCPSRVRSKVTEKSQQQQLTVKKPSDKLALGIERRMKPVCVEGLDLHYTGSEKLLEQIPKDICWRNSIVVPFCLRRCDCSCKAVPFYRVRSKVTEKSEQQQLTVKKQSNELALETEKGKKLECTSTELSPDESSDFQFTEEVKKSLSKSQKTCAGETASLSHSVSEGVTARAKQCPSRVRSKVTEKSEQQPMTVKKPSDKLALGTEKRKKLVCTSTELSPDESSDLQFTEEVKKSLSKSRKTHTHKYPLTT